MAKNVNLPILAALPVVALSALVTTIGMASAWADPHPDPICVSGLVWRAAYPGDAVCVRPEDRDRTAQENADAPSRRDPNGPYGPQSCMPGFVWRQAYNEDTTCVSPDTRRENLDWNSYHCGTTAGLREHTGYCGPYPPPPDDLG